MTDRLPVTEILPKLLSVLESTRYAVLQAPPGAGKTTGVPPALLAAPWLQGKNIWVLEPRRLAARASAWRMADMRGEPVGQTVGYHIRMERKAGPATRIEVMTEGILTRRIQSDPSLKDAGLVIFDEFHERNINSDIGLALCLDAAEALRPDLRILVMSATLDTARVAEVMGNAPVIAAEGKSFPVRTEYLSPAARPGGGADIEKACAGAVMKALYEEPGDVLVFLPGVGEIKRTAALLKKRLDAGVKLVPLYGNLSQKAQTAAIMPSIPGERKVVLATSIAETSITIEGVRVVVDSGLMRVPRFFSGTGMSRLETVPVSLASAEQRRGRAGRVSAGVCYRIWPEAIDATLKPFNTPEILCTELSGLALELALWGVSGPQELRWLDLPPGSSFEQARTVLKDLGALGETGRITPHGRRLAVMGVHPRLAHMMVAGEKAGRGLLACRLAAIIAERDFLTFKRGEYDPDIRLRLDMVEASLSGRKTLLKDIDVNREVLRNILKTADRLAENLKAGPEKTRPLENAIDPVGSLLAQAYPERVAKRRGGRHDSFLMASGGGAIFPGTCRLSASDYIVAVHLDGKAQNAGIFLAAHYSKEALQRDFGHVFKTVDKVAWDKQSGAIAAGRKIMFGRIVVEETPISAVDSRQVTAIMLKMIRSRGLDVLPWNKNLTSLRERVSFLKNAGGFTELPDFSKAALEADMENWLGPYLAGVTSFSQLKKIDLHTALRGLLTWQQQQQVEREAPTHIGVPSGSRIPLAYAAKGSPLESPVLAVRLQEMFGLTATPRVAGGRIPVTLHLLSPAGRPVQITRDLASFWQTAYRDVKKDLMGRYPKHFWPDDPLSARPTRRAKRRGENESRR